MKEIERKFLVNSEEYKKKYRRKYQISQAYLNTDPDRTIRVRINDQKAYLTIKGRSSENGLTRFEWEKEIPLDEAKMLLNICEPGKIEKLRYEVEEGEHVYEVDEFHDNNEGLVIAEVELEDEEEDFHKPGWLGKEVTGNKQYYNSNLLTNPYKNWKS
ncbi:CYTH domain-containing protein [Gramella sp. BOM4]|nr:CYTH domain-containing protein [Christiangramia bathymodioli]